MEKVEGYQPGYWPHLVGYEPPVQEWTPACTPPPWLLIISHPYPSLLGPGLGSRARLCEGTPSLEMATHTLQNLVWVLLFSQTLEKHFCCQLPVLTSPHCLCSEGSWPHARGPGLWVRKAEFSSFYQGPDSPPSPCVFLRPLVWRPLFCASEGGNPAIKSPLSSLPTYSLQIQKLQLLLLL